MPHQYSGRLHARKKELPPQTRHSGAAWGTIDIMGGWASRDAGASQGDPPYLAILPLDVRPTLHAVCTFLLP